MYRAAQRKEPDFIFIFLPTISSVCSNFLSKDVPLMLIVQSEIYTNKAFIMNQQLFL